ncbi:MAG: hypothetical protein CL424_02560 [Acidimicrobiaceae bacterium]|nr:hypothetical protein [Acidimicrobiaceae bacterium]
MHSWAMMGAMSRWMVVPVLALSLAACGGDDGDGDDVGGAAIDSVSTTDAATTVPESTTTTTTTVAISGGGSGDTTSTAAPTTAASTTVAPTTAAPTTTLPEPSPTTTAAPTGDCLVGNWVISDSEMNAFYDTIEGQIDAGDVEISISGQTRLDFTADTFRYTPAFTLTLDVVGQTGEGVTSGSVGGTYVGDDGLLTTTLTDSNLDVTVTVMGQTFNGSDMANGMLNSFPIIDSPYTCGPNPTIMFKTSVDGVRHPVTLTPA